MSHTIEDESADLCNENLGCVLNINPLIGILYIVLDFTDFLLPDSCIKHVILIKVIHTYLLLPQIYVHWKCNPTICDWGTQITRGIFLLSFESRI